MNSWIILQKPGEVNTFKGSDTRFYICRCPCRPIMRILRQAKPSDSPQKNRLVASAASLFFYIAKRIQNEIEDLTSAKMLDTPNTERARNAKKSCRPSRPTSKKCSGYRSRSMKKAV